MDSQTLVIEPTSKKLHSNKKLWLKSFALGLMLLLFLYRSINTCMRTDG